MWRQRVKEFYTRLTNGAEPGGGAEHIAVLMMDPDSGEVLAMANYPNYDYTLTADENLALFYTQEELSAMDENAKKKATEGLKQNFCLT